MSNGKKRNYTPRPTVRKKTSIPPSRAGERGKTTFNTKDNFPSQNEATTKLDSKKKGPFKKIRKKIGEVTKDWNADALGNAANVFGDISEKTKSDFYSSGGIMSQGGPQKEVLTTGEYDKEAQRILKKLGNPYE